MDALALLRSAIAAGIELPTDLENETVSITLPDAQPVELSLGDTTAFESQVPSPHRIDLKTALFCWNMRGSSIADYALTSEDKSIPHLGVLERTDLLAWLKGTTDDSEYIQGLDGSGSKAPVSLADLVDRTVVKRTSAAAALDERACLDHNSALQGTKKIDFSHVASECTRLIIREYRAHQSLQSSKKAKPSQTTGTVRKDPIIILSPSPSSLVNMSNIKSLLENGVFEPVMRGASAPNMLKVQRQSKSLGRLKIIVVDSVEKFKPEYWDRVVAVFVTGQPWQLKAYKWSDPNTLFHKILGLALIYKGDPLPALLSQWNVKVDTLERNLRFRDKEVVERLWERIEGALVSKGFAKRL